MEHSRLYEIKIEQLETELKELKQKLDKQDSIKDGYKEEIAKWNLKYKDLKKQITKSEQMIRTAECVSPMHPDKMCDRISDRLLDLHLQQDPNSRVAIETCGGIGMVFITGEVTSNAVVHEKIS